MDKSVKLDKTTAGSVNYITNKLIQSSKTYPVVCQYGHVFLSWYISVYSMTVELTNQNLCFLTDIELQQLHRCFGHLLVH